MKKILIGPFIIGMLGVGSAADAPGEVCRWFRKR